VSVSVGGRKKGRKEGMKVCARLWMERKRNKGGKEEREKEGVCVYQMGLFSILSIL